MQPANAALRLTTTAPVVAITRHWRKPHPLRGGYTPKPVAPKAVPPPYNPPLFDFDDLWRQSDCPARKIQPKSLTLTKLLLEPNNRD